MTRSLVLFDTSIYIPYLRREAYSALIEGAVRTGQVRLSVVVLAELYAGTRSPQDKADLDAVLRAYQSLGFLAVPTSEDWARAGQGIRWYRSLYGDIEPREHMNDVLILTAKAMHVTRSPVTNLLPCLEPKHGRSKPGRDLAV
jgi:predicted nucleic acid-binding protein